MTFQKHKCPQCSTSSKSFKGSYKRKILHIPIFEYSCSVLLDVRKYRCVDKSCEVKVFSEQYSTTSKHSRRSEELNKIIDPLSIELTSRKTSLVLSRQGVNVSKSTILRVAHSQEISEITHLPTAIGIDDWAIKKESYYGTIVIDHETSKAIGVILSRDKASLIKWINSIPGSCTVVTRDRASSYSSAVKETMPKAEQVADRFHLLTNLSDALAKCYKANKSLILKSVKNSFKDDIISESTEEIFKDQIKDNTATDATLALRNSQKTTDNKNIEVDDVHQQRFIEIKNLLAKGYSIRSIAKAIGCGRSLVRSYQDLEELPVRVYSIRVNINSFRSYILKELLDNKKNRLDIYNKISKEGYNGSYTQLYKYVADWKKLLPLGAQNILSNNGIAKSDMPTYRAVSSRRFAKYIGMKLQDIEDEMEREYIRLCIQENEVVKFMRYLTIYYKYLINNNKGDINYWLDLVRESPLRLNGLKSLANGIQVDIKAVTNAIKTDWSNGRVEEHVNRIKMIKRQMYGRAGFKLLRIKILLSS